MTIVKDIQTVHKVTKAAATTIGGRVAPGQKRYVTFLMVDNQRVAGMTALALYMASATVSNMGRASIVSVAAHRKELIYSYGSDTTQAGTKRPIVLPETGPDPDNPLFTIAGGSWLAIYASKNTVSVFMQWFDQ
jgi:hypothetical protein